MTRDHKVALIVGFALVMLVGVLISDHMSAAQEAQMDDAVGGGDAAQPGDAGPASPLPAADRQPPPVDAVAATPERSPASRPLTDALRNSRADRAPSEPASEGEGGRTHLQWLRQRWEQLSPPPVAAEVDQAPQRRDRAEPPAPTQVLLHPVQPGESLWTIAEGHYADGALWRKLAAFNDDRVRDGAVRAGVTLRIPPKAVLLGEEQPADSAAERTASTQPADQPAREYTIQAGDTLGELSQRFLGTVRRQDEIVRLNQDVIDDPDVLPVGETIRIPPK